MALDDSSWEFRYRPHPLVSSHKDKGPVRVADQARGGVLARFNDKAALKITTIVGTMWAAYAFAALALYGLPSSAKQGASALVLWISSEFFQLVLLPVIIVGQNLQSRAADKRSEQVFNDVEAILHETTQLQAHLALQDKALRELALQLQAMPERPGA